MTGNPKGVLQGLYLYWTQNGVETKDQQLQTDYTKETEIQKRKWDRRKVKYQTFSKEKNQQQWNQRQCAEMCDLASVCTGICMWTAQTHVKW